MNAENRPSTSAPGIWPIRLSAPYVVIEAPNGAGKSTCVQLVAKSLSDQGLCLEVCNPTRQPPHDNPAERLSRWLGTLEPDCLREQRYAQRAKSAYRSVRTDVDLVLGDRSVLTSLVTRLDTEHPTRTLNRVMHLQPLALCPSLVIVLEAPASLLHLRCSRRHRSYGHQHETERSLGLQLAGYRFIQSHACMFGLQGVEFCSVDATASPEDVAAQSLLHIRDHLNRLQGVRR